MHIALVALFEGLMIAAFALDKTGKIDFFNYLPESIVDMLPLLATLVSGLALAAIFLHSFRQAKEFQKYLQQFGEKRQVKDYKLQNLGRTEGGTYTYRVSGSTEYKGHTIKFSKFISSDKDLSKLVGVPLKIYFDIQDPTGRTFWFDPSDLLK